MCEVGADGREDREGGEGGDGERCRVCLLNTRPVSSGGNRGGKKSRFGGCTNW